LWIRILGALEAEADGGPLPLGGPVPRRLLAALTLGASGPMAVDLGRWQFAWPAAAKRPPGAPAVDSGKYIVRWVNDSGHWLMAQDIWNSDLGMPLPAPHK